MNLPNSQQPVKSNQPSAMSDQSIKTGEVAKEKELPESWVGLEEVEKVPELAPEVKEVGVAPVREEIELPPQVPPGVIVSGPAVPVTTQPTGLVKLPLTGEEIEKALHQKIGEAILWLASWCLRQLKIARQKVKNDGKS